MLLASPGSFATLRLPAPAPIEPTHASIACELATAANKENAASGKTAARTAPPTPASAWTACAGGRRSLQLDTPGFKICFDAEGDEAAWVAAADASPLPRSPPAASCHPVQLVAVRVMRHEEPVSVA